MTSSAADPETRVERAKNGSLVVHYKPKGKVREEVMMRITTTLDPRTDVLRLGDGSAFRERRDEDIRSGVSKSNRSFSTATGSSKSTTRVVVVKPKRKDAAKEKSRRRQKQPSRQLKASEKYAKRVPVPTEPEDKETADVLNNMRLLNTKIRRRFGMAKSQQEMRTFLTDCEPSESYSTSTSWDEEEGLKKSGKKIKKAKVHTSKGGSSELKSKKEVKKKTETTKKTPSMDTSSKSSKSTKSTKSSESSKSQKSQKSQKRNAKKLKKKKKKTGSSSSSEVLTAEGYDYRGVPLSHPMAVTPFPRACSAKTRERARQLLNECAKRTKAKEDAALAAMLAEKKKKKKGNGDSSSGTAAAVQPPSSSPPKTTLTRPTRVSSDTRFPGARSPATRERARNLLKNFVIAHEAKKRESAKKAETAETEEGSKRNGEEESSDSCASLRTIYSKNYNLIGCDKCTMCTDCLMECVGKHPNKIKLSAEEYARFNKHLNELRQKFGMATVKAEEPATQGASESEKK